MSRYNLLPNPSWETGTHGWTRNTPGGVSDIYSREQTGGGHLPVQGSWYGFTRRTTAGQVDFLTTSRVAVTAGLPYAFSIWVNRDGGGTCSLYLDWYNGAGSYLSTSSATGFNPAASTWAGFAVTGTAPAGAATVWPILRFHNMQANFFFRVDAAMLEQASVPGTYADGDTSGWNWTGTRGNSTSQNLSPVADAGLDQTATEGDTVHLSASGTTDDNTSIAFGLTYDWTVLDDGGTGLTAADITNPGPTNYQADFVAPAVTASTDIVLQVAVSDPDNTAYDTVTVTIESSDLLVMEGSGGVVLGGQGDVTFNQGNNVVGDGGLEVSGAADYMQTLSELVTGAGGAELGGSADLLHITPTFVTPAGGGSLGGHAVVRYRAASVPADVVVEWDLDGDGHFTRAEEDVTGYVMSVETQSGRDYPSQLTGRAGPGKLKAVLLNQDNRFSHFNAASPLNNNGMGLQVGSRLRLRTAEAENPDPSRFEWDSFDRDPGSLGTSDSGATWSGGFTLANHRATTSGTSLNIATVDAGATNSYAQVAIGNLGVKSGTGTGNVVGLTFRYADSSNYSRVQYNVAAGLVQLVDRVSGTDTVRGTYTVEPYDGMVLGAHASGATATAYLDGVPVITGTCVENNATLVGLYATNATGHARPWLDGFEVWDKPATEAGVGVLWTGFVSGIEESVELGPRRTVKLEAEGVLTQASSAEVYPTSSAYGRPTGLVVGNTLHEAGLLSPPGPIQLGDVTTGAFGYEKDSALEVCRDFEEAELGFLYETNEGTIGYESRTARDSRTSVAVFSDFPGSQLGYHTIEPRDWRRQIVNRVEAGVASLAPVGTKNYVTSNWAATPSSLETPTEHAGIYWCTPGDVPGGVAEGDLMLVFVTTPLVYGSTPGEGMAGDTYGNIFWTPTGWTCLDGQRTLKWGDNNGKGDGAEAPWTTRIYAKVADGTENDPVAFGYTRGDLSYLQAAGTVDEYNSTARAPHIVSIYCVSNFFGDVKEAVKVSEFTDYYPEGVFGKPVTTTGFQPPTVFPDWGPDHSSLFVTALTGFTEVSFRQKMDPTGIYPPDGYHSQADSPIVRDTNGGAYDTSNMDSCFIAWAERYDSTSVESPGQWKGTVTKGDVVRTVTLAIRGKNGDPPIKSGHVTVTRDDVASQRKYRVIRSHSEESNLFADAGDAGDYADLVLERYGNEKPIMALSFWAATTRAHRTQAVERRVGDRITVASDNGTGLNYSGDYFIESIAHKIGNGGKVWETTWELSPVPDE